MPKTRWMSACFAILACGPSPGASITYHASLNQVNGGTPFARFDPGLGPLQRVDVHASGTAATDFLIDTPVPPSFGWTGTIALGFDSAAGPFGIGGLTFAAAGTVAGLTPLDRTASAGFSFAADRTVFDAPTLGRFIGTGTLAPGLVDIFFAADNPAVHAAQVYHLSPRANAQFDVTYVYGVGGAVAEPASLTLGLVALACLALARAGVRR